MTKPDHHWQHLISELQIEISCMQAGHKNSIDYYFRRVKQLQDERTEDTQTLKDICSRLEATLLAVKDDSYWEQESFIESNLSRAIRDIKKYVHDRKVKNVSPT